MLASKVAAERCAGTEHEHGFVLIDGRMTARSKSNTSLNGSFMNIDSYS